MDTNPNILRKSHKSPTSGSSSISQEGLPRIIRVTTAIPNIAAARAQEVLKMSTEHPGWSFTRKRVGPGRPPKVPSPPAPPPPPEKKKPRPIPTTTQMTELALKNLKHGPGRDPNSSYSIIKLDEQVAEKDGKINIRNIVLKQAETAPPPPPATSPPLPKSTTPRKQYTDPMPQLKKGANHNLMTFPSEVELPSMGMDGFNLANIINSYNDLYDVELIVEDVSFPAHKVILACQSRGFGQLFKDKMDGIPYEISGEIDPINFRHILDFFYHGRFREEVALNPETLVNILRFADRFGAPRLKAYCKSSFNVYHVEPDWGFELIEQALSKQPISKTFFYFVIDLIKPLIPEIKKLPKWAEIADSPKYVKIIQKMEAYLEEEVVEVTQEKDEVVEKKEKEAEIKSEIVEVKVDSVEMIPVDKV